ncbi:hypothetical protein KL937_004807 [Ogataea polymorpha]|nr:hypothetical protein KL937_004807 [Ogataea polymorpha]
MSKTLDWAVGRLFGTKTAASVGPDTRGAEIVSRGVLFGGDTVPASDLTIAKMADENAKLDKTSCKRGKGRVEKSTTEVVAVQRRPLRQAWSMFLVAVEKTPVFDVPFSDELSRHSQRRTRADKYPRTINNRR